MPATLLLAIIGVSAIVLLPLVYLLLRAANAGPAVVSLLLAPRTLTVLRNSLSLTATVTTLALVLGTLVAWLTLKTDLPGRRIWSALTSLPLVLPSYVGAFALIAALGPHGMLQTLLEPLGVQRLPSIYGFPGTAIALALFTYPYVVLTVRAALHGLDPSLEDACRTLGLTIPQTFRSVVLPALRPALGAGALLVALYTLSDFGAVSLLQFNTFTREIYIHYGAALDRSGAAFLALMLAFLTMLIIVLEYFLRGRYVCHRVSVGSARRPVRYPLGRWRIPALLFCSLLTLFAVGLPVLVILFWLLRGWSAGVQFESQWYIMSNSASISAVAALPVAAGAVRYPGIISRQAERLAYMGHALPGIVVAIALVFFAAHYVPALYQTHFMLTLAYLILFLPLAIGTVRANLMKISPRTEEAARLLGRRRGNLFMTVTLPQLRPGLFTGFALVFLTALKELPATLLLGPTGFETLATRIWGATEEAFFAQAAAPALLLVLAATCALIILQRNESSMGEC